MEFEICVFHRLKCFQDNPVLEVFTLARSFELAFDAKEYIGWYPSNFDNIGIMKVGQYTGESQGNLFMCQEIYVSSDLD